MATADNGQRRIALVVGATGGLGGEICKALNARGWQVRGLTRKPVSDVVMRLFGPIEWRVGDAMVAADVIAAAQGATVIIHCANPPGYKNWRGLAMPMLASSIAAAHACGARLMFPGNIYNYGPDAFPLLSETSAQNPCSTKGAVRVEMERMLADAAGEGVRSVVLRAGDFFGPHQPASWFKDVMVKPGQPVRAVVYPGEPAVGHAWAYLPDLAETFVRVAEMDASLPAFETLHFGGHWLARGDEMATAILRVAGQPETQIKAAPWWMYRLLTPFVGFLREAMEMRYLWQVPVQLDNRKLKVLLGDEPHTPLDLAVGETLRVLRCLPAPVSQFKSQL